MDYKVFQILQIGLGLVLILFGGLGSVVGIIGIIDPVGTQMSDDSNPFGTPHTFVQSLSETLIFILIFSLGVLLVLTAKRVKEALIKHNQ